MYLFLILFGVLPALVWLVFFLQEDKDKPEPPSVLVLAFVLGALITGPIYVLQKFYSRTFVSPDTIFSFPSFLFLAFTEELGKLLVVYLFIRRSRAFDEPIDAMVYMIIAALGFATVENLLSIFNVFDGESFTYIEVSLLRLIGATLIHSFSSGLIGFFWGRTMYARRPFGYPLVKGLVLATVLHATFNFFIIQTSPLSIPLLILITAALFIFRDFELLKYKKPLSG